MQIYLKLTFTLFSMFIFSGCVLDDHSNQVYYESLEQTEENVPEVDESEIPSSVSLLEPKDQNTELIESTHDVTEDTIAVVNLEPTPQLVVEPAPLIESIVEPTPQPTVIETPEPVVEPTPQPAVEEVPEPVIEETPLPVTEPTPEPTVEEVPQPIVKPTPQPTVEETPEPVVEPTPEPAVEEVPEPVIEETPLPVTEPTPEPTVEETPEPVVEPTPEPAVEEVPEPVIEETPLPIIEPTPEPTIEETPEPIVSPTPEPTQETTPLPEIAAPTPICESGLATHQGKVTDSNSGEGLADVLVTINGCTTTTDSNGFYALRNIVEKTSAVVNFEKEGYLLGSTHIQLKPLSEDSTTSNYLDQYMYKCNSHWDYNSSRAINGVHIIIGDSISYSDEHGNIYSGINTAELAYFDVTTDKKILFPGLFKGINTNGELVQFSSYGIISLLIKDDNGNKLNLANDDTITLKFDAVPSLEKPDIVPLWYYDYDQGVWFEEGYAQLQEDGTYKGEISHLGTWSLNKPLENEPGIFKGRIIDENGEPMSYVRLQAIGNNWISSDISTDEEGIFEVEVIPDSEFKLKAYDYENKFGATSASLPALTSGEVNEDRM